MAGNLGPVKPWVASAADFLGKKFGIKDIGGYRAQGSVPGSNHPKGLALDLMTRKGDALAEYAKANAAQLGVTEVIWNRKIWTVARAKEGWRPYSGPSDHTDHVHLSFGDKAPSGKLPDGGGIIPGIPDPGDLTDAARGVARGLQDISKQVTAVGDLAGKAMWLTLPTSQVRIAAGFFGVAFLLIGIWFIVREAR